MRITGLRLRGILDSRARATVEADVVLDDRYHGRGSSPRAIAPGRRERPLGDPTLLGPLAPGELHRALLGQDVDDQADLDLRVARSDVGAAETLAVSLAFARAVASAHGLTLHRYLARLAGTTPRVPRLLVNVFSGGIHGNGPPAGFQQIMVIPDTGGLTGDIELARVVFDEAERQVQQRFGPARFSPSSGLLVPVDSERQLTLLHDVVAAAGGTGAVSYGVDVAAEHLVERPGAYRLGPDVLSSAELAGRLSALVERYPLSYLEDPFDPADEPAWRALRRDLPPTTTVIGDDLFATDAARVDSSLADGILLKLSQAGTLTATLEASRAAREAGLVSAVSHRSGETEDTAMCDLAVGVGAELIKVGGPRRGDRLAKYNQLLRLAETVPAEPPVAVR
ncbi:hypothetical protein I0C86_14460 [Plantactinospora sp. S1510]|uniref:Enolase n=1 Tax=Plantactinospora alkalitolerans TaxID=2789879 RepID=A0ABS0GVX3_9ACTN|nr:hypothetical protein [Plantactinospora alkalitolerans]MBF9130148.1 hypothetical protein [Plantactinospora alkalitolerans]